MSLLSQIVPRHAGPVLTIHIAGRGERATPAVAVPDTARPARDPGRPLDDATMLARVLLTDGHDDSSLAQLEAAVDENVDLWTPALHTTSRFELVSALGSIDDAITDVTVAVADAAQSGSSVHLAWLASGRFSRPAFLDDDHLIEPTGAVVKVAGATRMSFTVGLRAERISCYYDRLSLVEQMLTPGSTDAP